MSTTIDAKVVSILRCPVSGSPLRVEGDHLVAQAGGLRYPIRNGIPVLLKEEAALPAGFATLEEFMSKNGYR